MKPVSARFAAAILGSYRIATSAIITSTSGDQLEVPIVDGTVTLDQQAAVRGRCDITIVDDGTLGLVPDGPSSVLAPYGSEITLSRGIEFEDGSRQLVSLGVFRIHSAEIADSPAGTEIRVSGLDRASRVMDARFEQPYQVPAGEDYAAAILHVLQIAWPMIPTNFATTSLLTPSLIAEEGGDPWEFAQQMARAISMSLYFDGYGTCILQADSIGSPVVSFTEGVAGVLLTAGRRWTREGAFNRVIAAGENTSEAAPVRGVATDEDPMSPTYYHGPFGKVPRFYASPLLTTDAMAAAAAATILNKELGTTEQVQFGTLVLPHIEPGDVARITRARAGIDEDHILDQVTIPLSSGGTMTGQTRASWINR